MTLWPAEESLRWRLFLRAAAPPGLHRAWRPSGPPIAPPLVLDEGDGPNLPELPWTSWTYTLDLVLDLDPYLAPDQN